MNNVLDMVGIGQNIEMEGEVLLNIFSLLNAFLLTHFMISITSQLCVGLPSSKVLGATSTGVHSPLVYIMLLHTTSKKLL